MPATLHKLLASVAVVCAGCLTSLSQTSDYNQQYRPQVHFSPLKNWTNDPNGLVYFRGEYHLFFQYNPFGDEWGHMSWGHAVSSDLSHWHQLPVAIPEKDGTAIFTGSVVVDTENSSGFCENGDPCLVAIYTGDSHGPEGPHQNQNIAYSLDKGRTWKSYEGNPVLDLHLADFRDPSVSWNDQIHRWVMVVSLPTEHKVQVYTSPDLKKWTHRSDFGPDGDVAGVWECPNLLQIASPDGKSTIWALKVGLNPGAPNGGSGEQYFLGEFDGNVFTKSDTPGAHGWTNYGKDDYCAISYNGLPKGEGPILLGWMNNWQYASKLPTAPWRGQMSVPRKLTFQKDDSGLALKQEPIVSALRSRRIPISPLVLSKGVTLPVPYEVHLDFGKTLEQNVGIRLYSDNNHWTEIVFDMKKQVFYVDRTKSGLSVSPDFPARTEAPLAATRPFDLTVIVDRSSVEAFAQNATIAMTHLIFPLSSRSTLKLYPRHGEISPPSVEAWKLQSGWN